ncbi:MAG: glutamate synthase large subunit [Rhodobacterales bacterium]|nr:MAG: glutamate synthase large subunit [Rhodobacterales bacterium]
MRKQNTTSLYDPLLEHSACGVGFLTRKDSKQTHELLEKGHEALCAVPHRGGMSAEGVGDGAGVSVDLSLRFFSKLTGHDLKAGAFGVGNFFLPDDADQYEAADALIEGCFDKAGLRVLLRRDVPVDNEQIGARAVKWQLPIRQWVFEAKDGTKGAALDKLIHHTLLDIEAVAYTTPALSGLYPLSLSAHMQVLKGRLNSWEIVPYFRDLNDPDHQVHTMYFHTRFSTNTDPHPTMAQPFRLMAHNGELNTDKKNRLSEAAVAMAKSSDIIRPKGQSDSCRLDQTLNARVYQDDLDLVTAVVSMMPPAWENDSSLSPEVRAMFEYFSLYEEKNDGPAAVIFGDGTVIGARLDRLGLRPLRSTETDTYLSVMSEAGQIYFPPESVIRRGRIEAGGMLYFDHSQGRIFETHEALEMMAARRDYKALLKTAQVNIDDLPDAEQDAAAAASRYEGDLQRAARYVGYTHNQESFRFLMDPMLDTGMEKVSAMGYGNAINALSDTEGGVAKYFAQRFAQVTNPPLDSIRESEGMTLRVALGEKPHGGPTGSPQIVVNSPILKMTEILRIKAQDKTPWARFDMLYSPIFDDPKANEKALTDAIDALGNQVADFARETGGIAIVTDRHISRSKAAIPMILAVSAINQRLIEEGLRLRASLVIESGQISSAHHIACALGFGGSAVYPLGVRMRAEEKYGDQAVKAYAKFTKAAEKSLMKTMGKVGLCTVESYSGGEFFEPSFLDTDDPVFKKYFPNMKTPVGGVQFDTIAQSVADWHKRALEVQGDDDVPMLGLFKERAGGAGHSYGLTAVRGFVDMTEEQLEYADPEADQDTDPFRMLTLGQMNDAFGIDDAGYVNTSFEKLSDDKINNFKITPGYRAFSRMMAKERHARPAALRDVLAFPADISKLTKVADIKREMMLFNRAGNRDFMIRGIHCETISEGEFKITLTGPNAGDIARLDAVSQTLVERFRGDITGHWLEGGALFVQAKGSADDYLSRIIPCADPVPLSEVQPACEITARLASGAMSHGALVATAHEMVAHGTNMAGGLSNSGEGGENIRRFGTIRASKIKQFASGRFGVWAGYLADPNLEQIEIKIGQGAKPGEGGQLPAPKVTVEIAAARGGTPGVELISPPPHHDTYSIEDLAQLIHDAKAARVKVVVKLVSSEGIGTIAVGVAKAGADVINVAGNTGGTGAASVTSLKYTGRAAELGIAEVHQALCANGLRAKVVLRGSGAMQTGSDVVKASLMGADSFEFGTTALMMLKCVMAKNCNIKCPAGLTTNPEVFDGDPRALAQYLLNLSHEVREILARLGLRSLDEARGRADLLHLLDHPASVGQLNMRQMLTNVPEVKVDGPIYLERQFGFDDALIEQVKAALIEEKRTTIRIEDNRSLNNRDKTVGGQLSLDIERMLNYELPDAEQLPAVMVDTQDRRFFAPRSITVVTDGSAGQSFGAWCNDGMVMEHTGTCNDGVGKGASGGEIIVKSPKGGGRGPGENVLIGNFALFGATGGRTFIEGQAGDRFAVRNSGATVVVEGVGDFCAEYMTNGAVLNIGSFAKGFGNGMSGGFAYQYDPEGQLEHAIAKDSVLIGSLDDDSDHAQLHADAVYQMLTWHVEATQSEKATRLLKNWEQERKHFAYVMPRALLQYQDADAILAAKPRKDLVEELATALSNHQITRLKKAWKDGVPVQHGLVPNMGETDTEDMYRLLNSWTVLETAQRIAAKRIGADSKDPRVQKTARNLVLTEDFALMNQLAKYAREAVSGYDDAGVAALVASKRLGDFKRSLNLRNILSMDSPGTYGWILYQSRKNREHLGHIPSFEELFAKSALPDIAAAQRKAS